MIKKLRVGTRGSRLALWQAEYVVSLLGRYFPDIDFETVVIKTQGDKILDVAFPRLEIRAFLPRKSKSHFWTTR